MKHSEKIAGWIKKEVTLAEKKGIVFGLSGGIDSAVVGALCKLALGDKVLGLILPCKSSPADAKDAREVAEKFGIKIKEAALCGIFGGFVKTFPQAGSLAKANLKPRLRMAMLYYFANSFDYLVAGTGNKSELTIGYFTKYGDGGVDILPLGNLLKGEVRELAVELGVPDEIIKKPPSAGLWEDQTDEGEIGMKYEELDKIIVAIEEKNTQGIDGKKLARVKGLIKASEHKKCQIPMWEVPR